MLICVILAVVLVICSYQLNRFKYKHDYTQPLLFASISIISSALCLPIAFVNEDNFTNNFSVAIIYFILLLYYMVLTGVFIKNILDDVFHKETHFGFSIATYLISFAVIVFITDPTKEITSYGFSYVFIFECIIYSVVFGFIAYKSALKETIEEKNKCRELNRKREEFTEGYNKFRESCPKFQLDFTKDEYSDLWFTNSDGINYLAVSRNNLNRLGEELGKAIVGEDVFKQKVPGYLYNDIEPLFKKIKDDIESVNKDFNILELGIRGEDKVDKILNTHKYIKNLSNLVITDTDGQRVECDNLLVTEKGIFIVEVKNYGSNGRFTLNIDNSGRWERVYGSKSFVMDSPFAQNSRHIGIIKNILFEHNLNIPVYGVIVIANDTVDIINNSNNMVVRADFLIDTINNFRGETFLDIKQREDVASLFNGMRESEVKHTFKNYEMYNDINKFNELLKLIETNNNYREFIYNLYYKIFGQPNRNRR